MKKSSKTTAKVEITNYFLKALDFTISAFIEIIPFIISAIKVFTTFDIAVNYIGILSALKGIKDGFKDIYIFKTAKEENDKILLVYSIVSIVVYFIYIGALFIALTSGINELWITRMSYIVLGISIYRNVHKAVASWVLFARTPK